jgi:hypothetical protein
MFQPNRTVIFFLILIFVISLASFKKQVNVIDTGKGFVQRIEALPVKTIVWEAASKKRLAPESGRSIGYCGYPRMIQLYDKTLVCVYEVSGGNIECIKSGDKGNTWSAPVIVATRQNGINMAVPEIIELQDHSLLVSYNPRPSPIDSTRHFGIRTKKSYNGGLTWMDERLLYEAGSKFENGCWEPAQIQLPSGEVQLFFSNEGVYTKSNEQNISIFRSYDNGLTWTAQPQIVSFRSGKRDGMPVPVLSIDKKEILCSIEDNAVGQFKPSIIRASLKDNWRTLNNGKGDNRNRALKEKLSNDIYAGAPYLRQLTTGETILSYQSTEGRNKNWTNACMNVVVGNAKGKNFAGKNIPFDVPVNKSGLWNSLCILDDNTIIALTSTNAFALGATEVWMIKGHIKIDKN